MKFLKDLYLKFKLKKALKINEKEFDDNMQKMLPKERQKEAFDEEADILSEMNKDETVTIEEIEAQMKKISDMVYESTKKRAYLFNPSLTERKNERLEEPELDTTEGTKAVLKELTVYQSVFLEDFKRFHINYNSEDIPLYWEI